MVRPSGEVYTKPVSLHGQKQKQYNDFVILLQTRWIMSMTGWASHDQIELDIVLYCIVSSTKSALPECWPNLWSCPSTNAISVFRCHLGSQILFPYSEAIYNLGRILCIITALSKLYAHWTQSLWSIPFLLLLWVLFLAPCQACSPSSWRSHS